jgi:hypothetical protein
MWPKRRILRRLGPFSSLRPIQTTNKGTTTYIVVETMLPPPLLLLLHPEVLMVVGCVITGVVVVAEAQTTRRFWHPFVVVSRRPCAFNIYIDLHSIS